MGGNGDSDTASARPRILQYWPEVDGLRAVAMMAILTFHFDHHLLPGAFASVDIFYIISGFLITAILLQSQEDGKFSFARFYQRRIARIAPAFFLVLASTLVLAWFIYPSLQFAQAGSSAAFAAISMANVKLMLNANDYFQAAPDSQPLLHYWSLSVEEQYYLLFPVYIYAVVRWTRRALAITAAVTLASFIVCVVSTEWSQIWAFYMLPARAWELFAGVLITLARWRGYDIPARWAPAMSWAGILTILASMVLMRQPHFPGAIALVVVLGSASLIATAGHDTRVNRILASYIPVEIGKRSYGLYLWHWPIFSFIDFQLFASDFWVRTVLKFALLAVATWATYRFVERPARKTFSRPQHRRLAFIGFAVAVTGSFAVGSAIRNAYWFDIQTAELAKGGVVVGQGAPKVALIGDSQAVMYAHEFAGLARRRGFTLRILARPGAQMLAGAPGTQWPAIKAALARDPPDVVFLVDMWSARMMKEGGKPLADTLDDLRAMGIRRIFVLYQPPVPEVERSGIRAGVRPPWRERPSEPPRRIRVRRVVEAAIAGKAELIDPLPLFLKPDGSVDMIGPRGRVNWDDPAHLSDEGAERVMPLFERALGYR